MGEVLPLPRHGESFDDARGHGRMLRVSWHSDGSLVVSIWRNALCRATFRLRPEDNAELVRALVDGIVTAHAEPPTHTDPDPTPHTGADLTG